MKKYLAKMYEIDEERYNSWYSESYHTECSYKASPLPIAFFVRMPNS